MPEKEMEIQPKEQGEMTVDPEFQKRVADFIRLVREGKQIPQNFELGPTSMYGLEPKENEPFNGYDRYEHVGIDGLARWEKVLSPEAFGVIREWVENPENDVKIFYYGKTFQPPTTSSGRGSYYYWRTYPDCWMDIKSQPETTHGGEEIERVDISIAKKMSSEEIGEWAKELEKRYGLS